MHTHTRTHTPVVGCSEVVTFTGMELLSPLSPAAVQREERDGESGREGGRGGVGEVNEVCHYE